MGITGKSSIYLVEPSYVCFEIMREKKLGGLVSNKLGLPISTLIVKIHILLDLERLSELKPLNHPIIKNGFTMKGGCGLWNLYEDARLPTWHL